MTKRKTKKNPTRASGKAAPNCSGFYPLFKHMSEAHGLTLLDDQLSEICRIAATVYTREPIERFSAVEGMFQWWIMDADDKNRFLGMFTRRHEAELAAKALNHSVCPNASGLRAGGPSRDDSTQHRVVGDSESEET